MKKEEPQEKAEKGLRHKKNNQIQSQKTSLSENKSKILFANDEEKNKKWQNIVHVKKEKASIVGCEESKMEEEHQLMHYTSNLQRVGH